MIPLDSSEWAKLSYAYGKAAKIPALLEMLRDDPRQKIGFHAEPWFSLWSGLCHQGDTYEASYAAVPHIVRIGIDAEGPIDFGFFQLPACIEVARANGRGPVLPPNLESSYLAVLRDIHECAYRHKDDNWSRDMAQCVAAALAVASGQHKLAEAITNLDGTQIDRLVAGEW